VVEGLAEIQECLAVAQEFENDSRVILFVTLRPGDTLSQEIKDLVTQALKTQASPRHVPDLIIQAPEFPKTKSNKLVELAVADLINGRPVRDKNSLANPDALTWFVNLDLKNGKNL
jgi:acetoacetyl-CoA synthetase